MEQVQRENIPKQMQERIAAFENEFALQSLTHDGTSGADVWVAALENSEGKAMLITCTVKKNGGWCPTYSVLSRGSRTLQTVWRGLSMRGRVGSRSIQKAARRVEHLTAVSFDRLKT